MTASKPADEGVFHVEHPEDQPVIDEIKKQVRIWSRASSKAWRMRKRMEEARAAAAEREGTGA